MTERLAARRPPLVIRRGGALLVAAAMALGPSVAMTALAATTATDDSYTMLEDGSLSIPAPGVLSNDSHTGGAGTELCVSGVNTTALAGELSSHGADGSFAVSLDSDFAGETGFDYDVKEIATGNPCTGSADDTGHVTINVTPVNDPPVVDASGGCAAGHVDVDEDSGAYDSACVAVTSFGAGNESGQALAEWVVNASGSVGFSAGPSIAGNGHLQFTPAANQCGSASLSVSARDNGGTANGGDDTSDPVTFSINVACVNDPPTAAPDSFIVLKNTTLNVSAPGLLGNDSDIDSGSITAVKISNPSHGVLTLAADGSFSYTPATGYEGPDAFSYKASDGSLQSATRVVSITVTSIPPINTPTPFPTPTLTPIQTPTETLAEPSPSAEASASIEPSTLPGETVAPGASPSPSPAASEAPGPVDTGGGGLSLPVLLVILLFVLLLGFGAALYVPKWLAAQRGEPPIDPRD